MGTLYCISKYKNTMFVNTFLQDFFYDFTLYKKYFSLLEFNIKQAFYIKNIKTETKSIITY